MELRYLLLPVIGALIGYITNYIALRMIFHPKDPYFFLSIPIQGLLPKKRHDLAVKIANTIHSELLSVQDLSRAMRGLDWDKEINQLVDSAVEKKTEKYSFNNVPLLKDVAQSFKEMIKSEIKLAFSENRDDILDALIYKVEEKIDFRDLIIEKIDSYDIDKLEEIVQGVAAEELKYITLLGGVLGFLIGLLQMIILSA